MVPDCLLSWNLSPEEMSPTQEHLRVGHCSSSALIPPHGDGWGLPHPILSYSGLVRGPTYGLSEGIYAVGDLEVWNVLAEGLGQLLGGKAHGVDVVGSHGEALCWGLHDFQGGPEAVVDIHHGEPGAGLEVALKCAVLYCTLENLDCVV